MGAVLLTQAISEYLHVLLVADVEMSPGGQALLYIRDYRIL